LGFPTGWSSTTHKDVCYTSTFIINLAPVRNSGAATSFLAPLPGRKEDFCEGSSSHTHSLLCFIVLLYFIYFTCIAFYIKNPKKLESLVVVISLL
jgi:hypothetical protein